MIANDSLAYINIEPHFIYRQSKAYRQDYNTRGDSTDYRDHYSDDTMNHDDENDHSNMKAISQPKVDYWAGYYDFLINEGSYKFWAVFQVIRNLSASIFLHNHIILI